MNDKIMQRLLKDKIIRLEIEKLELLKALDGMLAIVEDSAGVAGYHLNENIAEWDEFDEIDCAHEIFKKLEVKE